MVALDELRRGLESSRCVAFWIDKQCFHRSAIHTAGVVPLLHGQVGVDAQFGALGCERTGHVGHHAELDRCSGAAGGPPPAKPDGPLTIGGAHAATVATTTPRRTPSDLHARCILESSQFQGTIRAGAC